MHRIATNSLAANGSQIPEAVAELQLASAARSPVRLSARSAALLYRHLFPQARLDLLQHVFCAAPVSRSGRQSDFVQSSLSLWSLGFVVTRLWHSNRDARSARRWSKFGRIGIGDSTCREHVSRLAHQNICVGRQIAASWVTRASTGFHCYCRIGIEL